MGKLWLLSAVALVLKGLPVFAEEATPEFTQAGELVRPADYREWTFVSSGLGMTYGPARPEPGQAPLFSNVFVNPQAYQAFKESGRWPDGTFLILELRRSEQNVSIDTGGRTQGALVMLEASVKDSSRFPEEGWAYFAFDDRREAAAPLPQSASCYSCHAENGAVEWTFLQFYPDLFEVARDFGTVRDDYDPAQELP